jgi:hypothetical protein
MIFATLAQIPGIDANQLKLLFNFAFTIEP